MATGTQEKDTATPTVVNFGKYKAEYTARSWTLYQHSIRTSRTTQEKADYWEAIGYYASMESVVNRLIEERLANLGTITPAKFLQELHAAQGAVADLFKAAP